MKRGELYLVQHPSSRDPRKQRVFVVVSRQLLIDSSFSTLICAPVYSRRDGLHTQVDVGIEEGLTLSSRSAGTDRISDMADLRSVKQLHAGFSEMLDVARD